MAKSDLRPAGGAALMAKLDLTWEAGWSALEDLAVLEAAPDLGPVLVVVDPLLEPVGMVIEAALLVSPPGDDLASALVGDDEGQDDEAEEEDDKEEHDQEVEPEEPGDATAGVDEPRDGDDHDEDAKGDHRPLEELLAVYAPPRRQPYPTAKDRDREEERQEVEDTDEVVAEANHLLLESGPGLEQG